MITPEDLEAFKAAGIDQFIAESHGADWAKVTDVHREIKVIKGRDDKEYMNVHWIAQNGHSIDGNYKIFGEHNHGFNRDQVVLLGSVSLREDIIRRETV